MYYYVITEIFSPSPDESTIDDISVQYLLKMDKEFQIEDWQTFWQGVIVINDVLLKLNSFFVKFDKYEEIPEQDFLIMAQYISVYSNIDDFEEEGYFDEVQNES